VVEALGQQAHQTLVLLEEHPALLLVLPLLLQAVVVAGLGSLPQFLVGLAEGKQHPLVRQAQQEQQGKAMLAEPLLLLVPGGIKLLAAAEVQVPLELPV
jgi:hypothetical protein